MATSAIIGLIIFTNDAYSRLKHDRRDIIWENIGSLKNNPYRERFTFLSNKYNFGSYENFKSNIKSDGDTSYRIYLYELLKANEVVDGEYVDFNTFLMGFENCNVDSIDTEIETLEAEYHYPEVLRNYSELFSIIIFVIIYPVRFLFYLVKWAIRVLGES
jgi:hypothetical protein